MDNTLRVSSLQRVCDLYALIEHGMDLHRLAADAMLEVLPLQQFHGDENLPVLVLNFVDGAYVWVVQCRGRLRLTLEASQSLSIFRNIFGQKLQGNEAVELGVLSFVDNTHPAAAKLFDDAVVRDGLADQR